MDFLEKLDHMMAERHLNKNTLSKACGIPYTTIDGWYKKGYAGLKLTTLRKLSAFFGVALDFWTNDDALPEMGSEPYQMILQKLKNMDLCRMKAIAAFISLLEQEQDGTSQKQTNV